MNTTRVQCRDACGSLRSVGVLFLVLCLSSSAQTNGNLDMSWHSIDGGGGAIGNGVITMTLTLGQPDAQTVSNGNLTIQGGFQAAEQLTPFSFGFSDNFANRGLLPSPFVGIPAFNAGATKESGEPNHAGNAGGKSVWWTWIAPTDGLVRIDTIGSSFDTLLAVYTGISVSNLAVVASNNDIGFPIVQSRVTFTAVAGTAYQIAVDGYNGASGNIVLNLTAGLPVNDAFAAAIQLSGTSLSTNGSNVGATKEAGEPDHAGSSGGKSIWWSWTAPTSGMVSVDTVGSSFNTLLSVYTGSSVTGLTLQAEDDDGSGNGWSRVVFPAITGTTYQIAVDGFGGASGNSVLNLQLASSPGVAVFDNPMFVNTCCDSPEYYNLRASLLTQGFQVVLFTDFIQAVAASPVVVIPRLANGDLASSLTVAEIASLQNFIRWGGTLIVHSSPFTTRSASLINTLLAPLSAAVTESITYDTFTRTAAASGTTFANNYNTLSSQSDSDSLAIASLPAGSSSIYSSSGQSIVTVLPYGSGRVIFLGWDWYEAVPLGCQSGGWLPVLASAVTYGGTIGHFGPYNDNLGNPIAFGQIPPLQTNTLTGFNVGATAELGEPSHAGYPASQSVWWTWTAPATNPEVALGNVSLDTFGSSDMFGGSLYTVLAVYTGTSISNLSHVVSSSGPGTSVSFPAMPGTTYAIAVDGVNYHSGGIKLNLWYFTGPAGGVISLDASSVGLSSYDTLQSQPQIVGPANVLSGGSANYALRATYSSGVITSNVTVWRASSFAIDTNGLFKAGNVPGDTSVFISADYFYKGQVYQALGKIVTVMNLLPPILTTPKYLPNNGFAFTLNGVPGHSYVIETASDLTQPVVWTNFGTYTLGNDGLLNLSNLPPPGFLRGFYRARAVISGAD